MKNQKIKTSISCKGIVNYSIDKQKAKFYVPKAGDVAVFKVESIGKHTAIQSDLHRNMTILPGDHIMASFGNRYATEQFEGYVPEECLQEFQILGMGGVVGILKSWNSSLDKIGPTIIKIIGYVVDDQGEVINTKYYHENEKAFMPSLNRGAQIILSIGSSMDSGKTTTAGFLCRGIQNLGKKVAYIKLTGTAYSKDRDFVFDCGANIVADFSDLGFPSTYMCDKEEILNLYQGLLSKVNVLEPDYIVIEIADGIFQRETNFLLNDPTFMSTVDGVVFSCGDSLSAIHGVQVLKGLGIVPKALCGVFTMSPLLIEEVQYKTEIPVFTLDHLIRAEYTELIVNLPVKSA
ncbi:MAG: hypothetical protein U0V72_12655 [Cytophagales bacterium]